MKAKIFITTLALVAGAGAAGVETATAQDIHVSGRVVAAPYFDSGHRLLFSQTDNIHGTARSAAMGGAFASLGADLSSMSINPAGLGFYRSSDWNFTQSLAITGMDVTSPMMRPGALTAGGSRTSYSLGNVGAAYNVYNGSGTLTSLTLGFGYNRAANFNSRTRIESWGDDSSITDMFARQLNLAAGDPGNPIRPGDLDPSADPWTNTGIYLDEWGAVLGWQTGLVGLNDRGDYGYFDGALPSDGYFGAVVRGGINDYNFSMGANITNILYVGATLNIAEISYTEETSYEEFYTTPGAMFHHMWFDQTTRIKGNGLGVKLGAILRPIEALRIGVAFHSPTWYTLDKYYDGAMGGVFDGMTDSADTGLTLMDTQHFNTAPRLTAGISGVIADRAVLALDWEMSWYDRIRQRGGYAGDVDSSRAESKRLYNPSQTFRAGFEYLTGGVALRAGGSYTMDFTRLDYSDPYLDLSDNPAMSSGFNVTGGLGFELGGGGYLDVAYIYNRARMTDFDLFFHDDGRGGISSQYDLSGGVDVSRSYSPTRTRHMISLTLGSRF
ncbi:MAG: hypothetical protein LBV18_05870 [Alistipes sp.]|jgi:hypothetical protein|nr:hypothetical protein [Alistipes sp.]